jgi:molybdenum cofactor cytidylyltransferase
MGRFKLALPWGQKTVIEQVVSTVLESSIDDVIVVLGHRSGEVQALLADYPVRWALNDDYNGGAMLTSIRTGLKALDSTRDAALLCLGDQPQMLAGTVRAVLREGARTNWEQVIIPSYEMRSGHPILFPRVLWEAALTSAGSLREILNVHRQMLHYLVVDTPTILADLDTPEDYIRAQQGFKGDETCG